MTPQDAIKWAYDAVLRYQSSGRATDFNAVEDARYTMDRMVDEGVTTDAETKALLGTINWVDEKLKVWGVGGMR